MVELDGDLKLLSPESFSSAVNASETGREGIAVRSVHGNVWLKTIDGDIVDDIKETYAAPTQDEIDALNTKMAIFGADAQAAAQLAIRNEEKTTTQRYHDYWLNLRDAQRGASPTSTLSIKTINFATDTIETNSAHGLTSGAELIAGSEQIGLIPGFVYYAVVVDATHLRLAPTQFDAAIAIPHDPANPSSGRIIDLQAGFDFDAAHPDQVILQRFAYTAQPDNDPNPIAAFLLPGERAATTRTLSIRCRKSNRMRSLPAVCVKRLS